MALIQPTWSADGTRIAYSAVASFGSADALADGGEVGADVWIVGADGYGKVRLTDGHSSNFDPTFAPDGRVYFSTRRGPLEHVWSLDPSLSPLPADSTGAMTREDGRENRSTQTHAATIIEPSEDRGGD
jgi:Tol biopolymer transport system component